MCSEVLSFHETEGAFLVTAASCDLDRGLCVFESHVFLRKEGRHVHELNFVPSAPESTADLVLAGFVQTRRLLSACMPATEAACVRVQAAAPLASPRSSSQHPFHRLWLDRRFAEVFWEIQDWTMSPRLRSMLAGITRYCADPAEAALISRIFNQDDSEAVAAGPYGF
jgi:hypothetical protein